MNGRVIEIGIHPIRQELDVNLDPKGTLKMISILKTVQRKLKDKQKDNTHADTHS